MMSTSQHGVPTIWNKVSSNNVRNNNHDDDSSSDEEPQARMRVGEMYQARVQQWKEGTEKLTHSKEGMLIWTPSDRLSDETLESFCQKAKEQHSYNVEQALGMLFWHNHDIKQSLTDMQNFTPMPDEWSMEDKILFEQAYSFHGKNFRKIQQLIPDKEISQLVKHYYIWKKNRTKTSLMDRQAAKRNPNNDSDDFLNEEGETESMEIDQTPVKTTTVDNGVESKHKLPKGIHLSVEDLDVFTSNEKGAEGHLESLGTQLIELKRQVRVEKQQCGQFTSKIDTMPQPPASSNKASDTWTEEETLLAVEGIKHCRKNYDEIADILGSKTAEQVKSMVEERYEELKIDEILLKCPKKEPEDE